jgi:hypothetical protein
VDRRSKLVVSLGAIALLTLLLGTWSAGAHTQTFKSNLTIHFDKKSDSFDGHVGTSSFCQQGRAVHVFEVNTGGGSDTLVGSTTSGHAGQWSGISSPGSGTFYATVDQLDHVGYGEDVVCLAGTSRTITVG